MAAADETGSGASRRLIGMAVLKANYDVNAQSYTDNFVPFALACLRTMGTGWFSAGAVKAELVTEFGLDLPEHAVTSVLKRAARQGAVERAQNEFRLKNPADPATNLIRDRDDLRRKNNALVDKLVAFAQERFERTFTFDDAESALLNHMDEHGVPLALRFAQCPDPRDLAVIDDPTIEHIVLEFIEHITHSDPVSFEYLEAVFQGSMLTSTLFLPDPGSIRRKFDDTTVYFDTALLIRVLGLAGPEIGGPALELTDMLKRQGADLACFQETQEELHRVLTAATAELRHGGRRRPTGQTDIVGHCVRVGMRASDLRVIVDQLEDKLIELGIHTRRRPKMEINLSVDESALDAELNEAINYSNPDARRHDLEIITAIHRVRRGWRPKRLEESRAILVTTNGSMVGVAQRHFRQGGEFSWPLAITDSDLATILWLKEPLAAPDLPKKRILADCYAALRPSPELWTRYLDEVDRLNKTEFTDEDLSVLRYSVPAQQALTSRSAGAPEAVNGDMVAQVLSDAKAALVAPERRRLAAVTEQFEKTEQERAASQAAADDRIRQLEAEVERAKGEVVSTKEAVHERDVTAARTKARRQARREANVLFYAGIVVIVVGTLVAIVGGPVSGPWRIAAGVIAVIAGLVAVAGAGWGWHLGKGRDRFQNWRAGDLEETYVADVPPLAAEEIGPNPVGLGSEGP